MDLLYTGGYPDKNFGWCLFMIAIAALQHQHFGNRVGQARKKWGVAYPQMYAEAGKSYDKDPTSGAPLAPISEEGASEYNRYQRVHGNNSENIATFYVLTLIGGLSFPVPAAVFSGLWILGRGLYAMGYYRGVSQRIWGVAHYMGTLGLLGLCVAFGIQLLREKAPYE